MASGGEKICDEEIRKICERRGAVMEVRMMKKGVMREEAGGREKVENKRVYNEKIRDKKGCSGKNAPRDK